jgi:uncharacterized OB-fold protein
MESPLILEAKIDIPYHWTAGEVLGKALDGLREGRLLGTICPGCGRRDFPPRTICKSCFRHTKDLFELPNRGVLETFTRSQKDGATVIYGIVKLEGSSSGLVHFINPALDGRLKKGMAMSAVFREARERTGHILDILHFDLAGVK